MTTLETVLVVIVLVLLIILCIVIGNREAVKKKSRFRTKSKYNSFIDLDKSEEGINAAHELIRISHQNTINEIRKAEEDKLFGDLKRVSQTPPFRNPPPPPKKIVKP